jgi:hypothetical protein
VNSVFEVLKDGKVELGEIVALGQKMVSKVGPSLNLSLEEKKKLVSEIVQKGLERVEKMVLSKLSELEKGPYSEQLSLVVSQVKDKSFLLLDALSVKNPYFSYLFGLCCGAGPLPDESSVVSMVVDKVQVVQEQVQEQVQKVVQVAQEQVQAVQEQVQKVVQVAQEQVQAVQEQVQEQVQVVQEQVQEQVQVVQEQVQQFQATIQESVDHQVTLTILEPPSDEPVLVVEPLANKVVEENPVVEASKAPRNDLD